MANVSSNGLINHSSHKKRKHKSRKKCKHKSQSNQTISLQCVSNEIVESKSIPSKQSSSVWKQWAETRAHKNKYNTQIPRNTVLFTKEFPSLSQTKNTISESVNKIEPQKLKQKLPNTHPSKPKHASTINIVHETISQVCNMRKHYSSHPKPKVQSIPISNRRRRRRLLAEQQARNIELEKKALTPLQKYIDHLLHFTLNEENKKFVLIQLRKLPWNDLKTRQFVIDRLYNIITMSFEKIGCIAAIIAGLNLYYGISCNIVDNVCEEIRVGLEMENEDEDDYTQRRLLYVKFLGELYRYEVVNIQVIMDTLYLIITYNNNYTKNQFVNGIQKKTAIDFRVCLCCMLLDVCGEYFRSKMLQTRCYRFLLYFQRFIAMHKPIPLEVQWWVYDVLELIAPNMKKYYMMDDGLQKILKQTDDVEQKDMLLEHQDALLVLNKDGDDNGSYYDCVFAKEYDKMMKQYGIRTVTIEKTKINKLIIVPIRVLSKKKKHK
eukprot:551823_1